MILQWFYKLYFKTNHIINRAACLFSLIKHEVFIGGDLGFIELLFRRFFLFANNLNYIF